MHNTDYNRVSLYSTRGFFSFGSSRRIHFYTIPVALWHSQQRDIFCFNFLFSFFGSRCDGISLHTKHFKCIRVFESMFFFCCPSHLTLSICPLLMVHFHFACCRYKPLQTLLGLEKVWVHIGTGHTVNGNEIGMVFVNWSVRSRREVLIGQFISETIFYAPRIHCTLFFVCVLFDENGFQWCIWLAILWLHNYVQVCGARAHTHSMHSPLT